MAKKIDEHWEKIDNQLVALQKRIVDQNEQIIQLLTKLRDRFV